ncbi:MAG: NAD(+) synthase [Gemmatimonadota bacterium]|nr:NAD(+) synthase [Gemmatimonadota bacterium]
MIHGGRLRVGLCQIKPRKGDLDANVALVRSFLQPGSDILVFPETALTGYFVEGAASELALTRDGLVRCLGQPPEDCPSDVVLGFYEGDTGGVYNSIAYLTPGAGRYEVVHIHRKVFLPTYGLFEESRFVEPGRTVQAFDTRFGRVGMLVCEDLTHSLTASILALGGANLILCGCASPARGFAPALSRPANLVTWDRIAARAASEHGVFLLLSQLAGSEGGKLFPGGSSAWGPDGRMLVRGPLFDQCVTTVDLDPDQVTRVRAESPYLSDLTTALPHLLRSLERSWADGESPGAGGRPHGIPESPVPGDESAPHGGTTPKGDVAAEPRKGAGTPGTAAPASKRQRPDSEDLEALAIDPELVETALVEFIREEVVRRRGFCRVVIGVSGGVDSAVSLILACRALGPDNVFAFRLPYATSSPDSLEHARLVISSVGAHERTLSITGAVDAYINAHEPEVTPMRRGNVAARQRSLILFDQSAKLGALPLGTGNKSERLLGYYTWHADDSPPINPLGDLFKTQVWALARHLDVPPEIVEKPASADLIRGVHDEDELGISYHRADPVLHWLLQGHDVESLAGMGFARDEVVTVWRRLSSTHWKRQLPTVALLSDSAIGEWYLRPVDY